MESGHYSMGCPLFSIAFAIFVRASLDQRVHDDSRVTLIHGCDTGSYFGYGFLDDQPNSHTLLVFALVPRCLSLLTQLIYTHVDQTPQGFKLPNVKRAPSYRAVEIAFDILRPMDCRIKLTCGNLP
jgi:hypothetical protein